MYILGINPTTEGTGGHDPSAVLFKDGQLRFGAEEERYVRDKHAVNTFPSESIKACLIHENIELSDLNKVVIPWRPREGQKNNIYNIIRQRSNRTLAEKAYHSLDSVMTYAVAPGKVKLNLSRIGTPVPPIEFKNHHLCHAASAFEPSGFDNALVLTADGQGEKYSTVLWEATTDGLERIRAYKDPNSLGKFYSAVTAFLGYQPNNGEGKIMGLAPYGKYNPDIADELLAEIETGVEYDVKKIARGGAEHLEQTFGRSRASNPGEFCDWEEDLAFVTQSILEGIVTDIIKEYCRQTGLENVCLAGGVALNCKMNKKVMELDCVEDIFIQPVSHDAGTALGAGLASDDVNDISAMKDVYWGPEYSTEEICNYLDKCKLTYSVPDDLERFVAKRLAEGDLIGWLQGRLEMGPRALGNRSILADPRTTDSRDRVNEFVKHRESWRPFAPSMLEEAVDKYLVDGESAPYMIKTFDIVQDLKTDISAVLHPADDTTRPQTVREDQNKKYYTLIEEFENITGVPVILNTSFNDRGEPIVRTPSEAVKDFFSMGLDILVLEDVVVKKQNNVT